MKERKLELEVYYGKRAPFSNTTLLFSGDQALLIDSQFQKSDARELVEILKESGKTLTTILLTHSHPDHVWGGVELLRAFPEAKAYARPAVIKDIEFDFPPRLLRWTGVFNGEIPEALFPIEPLEGDVFNFDGHDITVIDSLPSETINMTTYYIPGLKTYVASDQAYNKCHYYVPAGLNRPDLWIESIEDIMGKYEIERLIPGHGAVGGIEIFEEALEYLKVFQQVAKPLITQKEIVEHMLEKYPNWDMDGVLYMSIGPAMTANDLISETGGKVSFGHDVIVDGYYRASDK